MKKGDIEELHELVHANGPLAALPVNLSDGWLKIIASDMFRHELDGDDINDRNLSKSLLLIITILTSQSDGPALKLTTDEIYKYYQYYQARIVREIAERFFVIRTSYYEL
jgi:hypothetical protein